MTFIMEMYKCVVKCVYTTHIFLFVKFSWDFDLAPPPSGATSSVKNMIFGFRFSEE